MFKMDYMKRLLLLFLFLVVSLSTIAQERCQIATLKDSISRVDDSKKSSLYIKICSKYIQRNTDTAIYYGNKAYALSERFNNIENKALSLSRLGYLSYLKGNIAKSKSQLIEAVSIANRSKSSRAILQSNNFLGVFYSHNNNIASAICLFKRNIAASRRIGDIKYEVRSMFNVASLYYKQSKNNLAIRSFIDLYNKVDSLKDWNLKSKLLINIGNVYRRISEEKTALDYYKKAIMLSKQYNYYNTLRLAYTNSASIYLSQKKYDEALKCLKKSIALNIKMSDYSGNAQIYNQTGRVYLRLGMYDLAEKRLLQAVDYSKQYNSKEYLIESYLSLIEVKLRTKKYTRSYKYLLMTSALLKDYANLKLRSSMNRLYSEYYFENKKFKKAYEYRLKHEIVEDSIGVRERIKVVEEQRTRFETRAIISENKALKKESVLNQKSSEKKSDAIKFLGLTVCFMMLFLIHSYAMSRKNIKINKKLGKLNLKLSEVNNTKDKFFAILSHDLRSPFNTIIGFSNLINEEVNLLDEHENLKEYSAELVGSSERTLDLLDSILAWAKGHSNIMTVKKDKLDIENIFDTVANIYSISLKEKCIECVVKCDYDYEMEGDEDIVKTILRNLLSNSIKFTRTYGKIELGCTIKDDKTVLYIKDNGIGISKANQNKIFSVKDNISNRGTNNEAGSGAGLILIKDLAIMNGGDIWFESEEGKGTIFYVSLNKA